MTSCLSKIAQTRLFIVGMLVRILVNACDVSRTGIWDHLSAPLAWKDWQRNPLGPGEHH